MGTESDFVGWAPAKKSAMCCAQGMRSLSDAESESKGDRRCWTQNMMIDVGENRAEKRKGECHTADIGMKAVTPSLRRRHFETSEMECGGRRVPPTLRAVPWATTA